MKFLRRKSVVVGTSLGVLLIGGYFGVSRVSITTYDSDNKTIIATTTETSSITNTAPAKTISEKNNLPPVMHLKTPEPVKGIYMTSCVASTPSWRERLVKLVQSTELNSIVIDIKDYSGTISFTPTDPLLKENGGEGCRSADMQKFVALLHDKGIYVIGRITVFQDPYYAKIHPELAVKRLSDGATWKDFKGLSFIDVGAKPFWDYIVALSKESYSIGFDELNFDYVRFPSDGNMKDIDFTWDQGKTKAEALREFFEYLHGQLKGTGIVLSVDLFGMTTTNTDDLNIGQILENTLPYFDFIDPMVYPSHYPAGFNGYKNVNAHPYDIVKFSLDRAVARAAATTTTINLYGSKLVLPASSTTPALWSKPSFPASKIRPWLQDFDYPVTYTPEMVKAQIQATYDAGLRSWLLWDAGNKYTPSVLDPAPSTE